jgi:hypothetical protein
MTTNHSPNGSGFLKMNEMFGSPPKAFVRGGQALISSSITFHDEARTLGFLISLIFSQPLQTSTKDHVHLSVENQTRFQEENGEHL